MLKVVGFTGSTEYPCIVSVNDYVPVTFRTQREPLGGVRYIRLGNFENCMLELIISADSMTLRGVTVTLVGQVEYDLMTGVDTGSAGLPVLELPQGIEFTGPLASRRANVACNFSLATSEDVAEISIENHKLFDARVIHGNVWFLMNEEKLVGIRFLDLDADSIKAINSFNHL